MTDRNSPVTEDELHAYVDGELPADRSEAVAAWLAAHPGRGRDRSPPGARRPRRSARATAPSPTSRCRSGSSSTGSCAQGRPGRSLAALAAAAAVVAFVIGGGAGWMARGASAAAPSGAGIDHRRRAGGAQALRGRGAPSGRSAGRRARAHDAMAVEAARLCAAHPRPAIDRPQAGRRPAAAGPDRRRGVLHV